MIRVVLIGTNNELTFGDVELLEAWSKKRKERIWIDFEGVSNQMEREIMDTYFSIDSLAIDDAQRERHPPKYEAYENYFFLLLKAFNAETTSIDFDILHISFFVGNNFLLTRHDNVSPSINKTLKKLKSGKNDAELSPQHLCYMVIRVIISRYAPIVLGMEKKLEDLEETMLTQPDDNLLGELIQYNSKLKKLRRIFGYQEKILAQLMTEPEILGHDIWRHEFNDVHEQMERMASLSGLFQELTRDLIDGYISVSSHNLNKIMKVLTIATVIFLPLTFMAGIYGMNFEHMPELKIESAYYILLSTMSFLGIALVVLFKKINWL